MIDPEFLSRDENGDEQVDAQKFQQYHTWLGLELPGMVQQVAEAGFDEAVFDEIYHSLHGNWARKRFTVNVAIAENLSLGGHDYRRYLDQADHDFPAGSNLAMALNLLSHKEKLRNLRQRFEENGLSLSAARDNNRTMGLLAEHISDKGSGGAAEEGFDPEAVVVDPVADVLLQRLGSKLAFMTVTTRLAKCPDEDYFVNVIARDLTGKDKPYSYDEIRSSRNFKYLTHYLTCHWTEDSVRRKLSRRLSNLRKSQ